MNPEFSPSRDIPLALVNTEEYLSKIKCRPFTQKELGDISIWYSKKLQEGVLSGGNQGFMRPTGFSTLAPEITNHDKKEILVCGIGGGHAYASRVVVNENFTVYVRQNSQGNPLSLTIPLEQIDYGDSHEFFQKVVDEISPISSFGPVDACSFIFSFYGEPKITGREVDLLISSDTLEKGLILPDMANKCVGKMFMGELVKSNSYFKHTPYQVLNDAVGVLLSSRSNLSVVVGTGFNIAIARNNQIYNTQSGRLTVPIRNYPYGETDPDLYRYGEYSVGKDITGRNVGRKMTSIITTLSKQKIITNFEGIITAELLNIVLSNDKVKFQQITNKEVDDNSWLVFVKLASLLRLRSAQLTGTLIGAAINTFPEDFFKNGNVQAEGSFLLKTPDYIKLVEKFAKLITRQGKEFKIVGDAGSSIIGAAKVAAAL